MHKKQDYFWSIFFTFTSTTDKKKLEILETFNFKPTSKNYNKLTYLSYYQP